MASRRSLVCVCGFCGSPSVTHVEEVHDLLSGFGLELSDSSDDYAFFGIVSEVEVTRSGNEKVSDHLVVNLDISDVDIIFVVFVFVDSVENVFDCENTKLKEEYFKP